MSKTQLPSPLRVRSIAAHELHPFTAFGNDPDHHRDLQHHLQDRWASGRCRPEWCFVAEQQGRIIGRIAFWTPSGAALHCVDPLLLQLPAVHVDLDRSHRLLRDSVASLQRDGAQVIAFGVDTPTDFDRITASRIDALLRECGWLLQRETLRFRWGPTKGTAVDTHPRRLVYRPLAEVGEDAFIRAIGVVIEGTLDRANQRDLTRTGPQDLARAKFAARTRLSTVEEGWWQLAYAPGGTFAGLVMPRLMGPEEATIHYIGVAPEQRGHGYIDDLLARAMHLLAEAGTQRIIADTDTHNWPMAAAFSRAGWQQFATSATYHLHLPPKTSGRISENLQERQS